MRCRLVSQGHRSIDRSLSVTEARARELAPCRSTVVPKPYFGAIIEILLIFRAPYSFTLIIIGRGVGGSFFVIVVRMYVYYIDFPLNLILDFPKEIMPCSPVLII
jgi:hypothetical protein